MKTGKFNSGSVFSRHFQILYLQVSGGTKYTVTGAGRRTHKIQLRLPRNLTCKRCVMQWWYRTGNSWGCEMVNGKRKCGLGYGPQESFVNCADVKVQ